LDKQVIITNGVGTSDLINGTYAVSADVAGYENATIDPSKLAVVEGTNTYSFTISASGSLTLHVTEEGTSAGTPIVGATFVRTDQAGTTYGEPVTTDASGNAVFSNVPYDVAGAPTVYYMQTASDGNHEFDNTVQSTSLTSQTSTIEIANAAGEVRTINLTDANYANLPLESGTLTLSNN